MAQALVKHSPLLCFLMVLGLLLSTAYPYLLVPAYPDWDIAADMLLVDQLRAQGYQLTGHYSQYRFNHPGPFFVYYNWLAETLTAWLLPSRFNAWVLGSVVANSLCITLVSQLLANSCFQGCCAFPL